MASPLVGGVKSYSKKFEVFIYKTSVITPLSSQKYRIYNTSYVWIFILNFNNIKKKKTYHIFVKHGITNGSERAH